MDSQQNVENRESLKQMLESAWAAKAAGLLMIDVASLCEIARSVFELILVIFLSAIIIIILFQIIFSMSIENISYVI